MKHKAVLKKFGDFYFADENTFKMGIDQRIMKHIAQRFEHLNVLETCTGGGFSTISLARVANKVTTIEIDANIQIQAKKNVQLAGLTNKVDFILGDTLNEYLLSSMADINSAFLDPDWNDMTPGYRYNFNNSKMRPPADFLLNQILNITDNVALILPPYIHENELSDLPEFELQKIYLNNDFVLLCIYFGSLLKFKNGSELRV